MKTTLLSNETFSIVNGLGNEVLVPSGSNGTLALESSVAPAFVSSLTYQIDDVVMHEGTRWRCSADVSSAGSWTGSLNWFPENVDDSMQNVISSIPNIYVAGSFLQNFTDAEKELIALNSGMRYMLILNELVPTIVDSNTVLSCSVFDMAINTIALSSDEYPLVIMLPRKSPDNRARDFMIRLEITAPDVPEITFELPDNEEADFESLDNWTQIIPGVNFLSFTETKNGLIE